MGLFIGWHTGNYQCQDCGYVGPVVIEEEKIIRGKEMKKRKQRTKKQSKKAKKQKTLYIILDGASDRPSAFAKAKTPNLDKLAENGYCGIWTGPHAPHYNAKSMSSVATLQLLGYSYHDEPGRGYLEALGINLKPGRNSVCFRTNFGTVDKNMNIIDRRSGRDTRGFDTLAKSLNKKIRKINNVKVRLYRSVGHRNVLVFAGKGLDKNVSDGDIASRKPAKIRAKKKNARKTARIVNEYLKLSHEFLSKHPINKKRKMPANYLLVRAAGSVMKVPSFRGKYGFNAVTINGIGIVKGIARYVGIKVATPNLWENYEKKITPRIKLAEKLLKRRDFVLLHINGADIHSHDKNFRKKTRFLEQVDKEVFSGVAKMRNVNVIVISDHITLSKTGEHVFGPVPLLIYTARGKNKIRKFDEEHCKKGFVTRNPMKKLLQLSK